MKRKLKANLIDYKYLTQLIRANPNDKLNLSLFFRDYEKSKNHDLAEKLTYLKLKYLNENKKWAYLNEIGKIYKEQNKQHVAFMCFAESLRLKPEQPDIFALAESLKESVKPVIPAKLKENNCAVSVTMATYNRTEQIKESIQSVLNQTFQDFELIVINDGGTDEVKDIVDSFKSSKIKYHKLSENRGLSCARNEGILRAEGKYIAYLDDDDIYYPDCLETLVQALDENTCKFVYLNTKAVIGEYEDGEFKPLCTRFLWDKEFNKDDLLLGNYISVLSIMHHKSIFNEVGLFDESIPTSMDWEMWIRSSLKFNFLHVSKTAGEYRIKQDNKTSINKAEMHFFRDLIQFYYQFYQGTVAFIRYYLVTKQEYKARELYQRILVNYAHDFKTPAGLRELIEIAEYFKDHKFVRILAKDYFRFRKKSCLQYIIRKKSLNMFLSICPYLPSAIAKTIKRRTANFVIKVCKINSLKSKLCLKEKFV